MQIVGKINAKVQKLTGMKNINDNNIYLGSSNIKHIKSCHPNDYLMYGNDIINILNHPDYIGINPKDNSIEYVKEFKINNNYVKVAVRISKGSKHYVRSLYTLNSKRVRNFINKGTLKKY